MKIKHTITRDRYWTNEEAVAFFRWAWRHRRSAEWRDRLDLVRIVIGTGARINEIASLKLCDCHRDGVVVLRETKTDVVRQVRITPEQYPRYVARLQRFAVMNGNRPTWLFENPKTKRPYSTKQLRRWWKEACAAAGVRDCKGPHSGRHTYATWEIASRRRLPSEVQQALGHTSFDMTADFYAGAPSEWAYQDGMPPWFAVAAGKED